MYALQIFGLMVDGVDEDNDIFVMFPFKIHMAYFDFPVTHKNRNMKNP